MSYKQFDREEHTDIISNDFRTTFHIYRVYGCEHWRVHLLKYDTFGKVKDNEINQTFIGFKTREEAIKFVNLLIIPDVICVMKMEPVE